MPATTNLKVSNPGINPAVVSVTGWFYPVPWEHPPAPTPMPSQPAEVAINVAHYVVYEGFTGKNGAGSSVGRGSVDTGAQTCLQAYQATTMEDLLIAAFPAPGPP